MGEAMFETRVLLDPCRTDLDSCYIAFRTTCKPAIECLAKLPAFRDRIDHRSLESGIGVGGPALCYHDRPQYDMHYDSGSDSLMLSAPWTQVPASTLLPMSLRLLEELIRQRRGVYMLHASAVIRGDAAIVFSASAESGKTITAIELCLNHGFRLFANDRVLVGIRDGKPTLLRGDASINCRLAGLKDYSSSLNQRIFGHIDHIDFPWRVKKVVSPEALGIKGYEEECAITHFVFLKLDATATRPFMQELTENQDRDALLLAKVAVFQEICGIIRGALYAPFDSDLKYVELFVPCLDNPEFLRRRVCFMETLFSQARVMEVRSDLRGAVDAILNA